MQKSFVSRFLIILEMFLRVLLCAHDAKTNYVNIAPGIHLLEMQRQIL